MRFGVSSLSLIFQCTTNYFQLGHEVSTPLQLLYIGVFGIIVAGLVQFLDEKDRFFSSNISQITVVEWGMYIGVALSGTKQEISKLLIIASSK